MTKSRTAVRLRGDDEGGKVAEIKTIAACAAVPKSEGEKL
jgi:hypothetical protein